MRIHNTTVTSFSFMKKPSKKVTPMSTIDSYKTYGITKKQLHSILINIFHIPTQYHDCLSAYYIKHWSGTYLLSKIKDGVITDNQYYVGENPVHLSDYMVIYQGCTPYQVRHAKQVKLSFRKPKDDFGLSAYVVVKIITDKDGDKF